ncbi:primosomal protein DnaT [Hafnia alvei]|uniref:primosomal protein DnaT n=1 Tax=Hafnia alvei TaxID=569 RepID=UPI0010354CEA|nr:primosomal protein DnaT [Hafnia alvei]TBL97999.1 primosomal protein DnaT [Hafnia alvei]
MSVKILATSITSLESFNRDPAKALKSTDRGVVTVIDNDLSVFYVVTPERMSELLEFEQAANRTNSDVVLEDSLFNDERLPPIAANIPTPIGKFVMYEGWQPDADFLRMAAMWGCILTSPVTPTELASFVAYWQAEGKAFHHVQWQQKLARSVQQNRMNSAAQPKKRDVNDFGGQEYSIPKGFRGYKG